MMFNKFLCFIVLTLSLTGCNPGLIQETVTGQITCVNLQDKRLNFSYLPQNVSQWHSDTFNVNVYTIRTIDGKHLTLNSLELENYTCT